MMIIFFINRISLFIGLICLGTNHIFIRETDCLAQQAKVESVCERLSPPSFKIFSSLTLYENSKKSLQQAIENHSAPSEFIHKTLSQLHNELISKQNSCVPISFYFVGRHAARFPKDEKIEKHNKDLNDLKESLRELTKKFGGNKAKNCDKFLQWTSKMNPKQGNLITELGGQEEQDIARRFKQIYPDFFNTNKATIDVAVTSKIRTSQTEVQFSKLIDGYSFPGCEKVPANDINSRDYNADSILSSKCYKNLMEKEVENFLQFHQVCKERSKKEKKPKSGLVEKIKSQESKKRIMDKVSDKLGVKITNTKTLESIVRMCIHETALGINSVWCTLLDNDDIKALDYIEDTMDYIDESYGPDSNNKMACPLVGNMVNVFETTMKESSESSASGRKKKSYFYFTHDHALKRFISYLGLFEDNVSFTERAIDDFIKTGRVPENRRYQISKIIPFSGNFAFITYKCQKHPNEKAEYKLVTTLNERPIKISTSCYSGTSDLKSFIEKYNNARTDCDLNKICPI